MADDLDTFIAALTGKMAAMAGVAVAPEHPPEALNEFPIVVCYFVRGEFTYGSSLPAIGVHTVHCDVHLSRSNLPHDEEFARPYILRGLAAIANEVKMDSTCQQCILEGYEYGRLSYAGQETFGVRYILRVKFHHTGVTVAV